MACATLISRSRLSLASATLGKRFGPAWSRCYDLARAFVRHAFLRLAPMILRRGRLWGSSPIVGWHFMMSLVLYLLRRSMSAFPHRLMSSSFLLGQQRRLTQICRW